MEILFQIFFFGLIGASLVQVVAVLKFASAFGRGKVNGHRNDYFPRALVLMSLRGADKTLPGCLAGILNQDYPCYDVHIVIDNEKDPAWDLVQKINTDRPSPRVTISPLIKRLSTAGLKNSALLQVLENIPDHYEVVMQLDGDVIPHREWVKELVAPLANPEVGASMGNRWYAPTKGNWGSMVLYILNAYNVPFMYFLSVPWAGTFAMKTEVIRKTDVLKWLGKSIIDDNVFYKAIHSLGLKLTFVPNLMMVQKINQPLIKVLEFYKRQLLWTRLYHPQWVSAALLSLAINFLILGAALFFLFSMLRADELGVLWTGSGLLIFISITIGLFALMESKIRVILKNRGEFKYSWFHPLLILAIPLSQLIAAISLGLAAFARKVTWRGVSYLIRGPWEIQRLND